MKKIPPFKLVAEPLDDEAKSVSGFKWAGRDIGTRHKLGGEPDHIDDEDIPKCCECEATMTFYAQLDSLNDDYNIADCALIYTFVCFDCFTVKSIIQTQW